MYVPYLFTVCNSLFEEHGFIFALDRMVFWFVLIGLYNGQFKKKYISFLLHSHLLHKEYILCNLSKQCTVGARLHVTCISK